VPVDDAHCTNSVSDGRCVQGFATFVGDMRQRRRGALARFAEASAGHSDLLADADDLHSLDLRCSYLVVAPRSERASVT
jgi:hypothetical protein